MNPIHRKQSDSPNSTPHGPSVAARGGALRRRPSRSPPSYIISSKRRIWGEMEEDEGTTPVSTLSLDVENAESLRQRVPIRVLDGDTCHGKLEQTNQSGVRL
jgi:hypothetical protein